MPRRHVDTSCFGSIYVTENILVYKRIHVPRLKSSCLPRQQHYKTLARIPDTHICNNRADFIISDVPYYVRCRMQEKENLHKTHQSIYIYSCMYIETDHKSHIIPTVFFLLPRKNKGRKCMKTPVTFVPMRTWSAATDTHTSTAEELRRQNPQRP
jgi:hypothetical protein